MNDIDIIENFCAHQGASYASGRDAQLAIMRMRDAARVLWAYRVLVHDAAQRKSCRVLLVALDSQPASYEAQALRLADELYPSLPAPVRGELGEEP